MANLKFDKAITALIVIDAYNDLTNTAMCSSLLGKQVSSFRCREHLHPGCQRALSSPAQLGRAHVSQTYPLQQG
jgi:hypothetical protein